MSRFVLSILVGVVSVTSLGCGPRIRPLYREMLSKSISEFTYPIRDNNTDKVWIHNMSDSECDRGDQAGEKRPAQDGSRANDSDECGGAKGAENGAERVHGAFETEAAALLLGRDAVHE